MDSPSLRGWLPVVVTVGLMFAVPIAVDATVSYRWANLAGLTYLVASPAVYRVTKRAVDPAPGVAATTGGAVPES